MSLDLLEEILRKQLEGHRALLGCIEGKRRAIRETDLQAVGDLCRSEQQILLRLESLETRRREVAASLAGDGEPAVSVIAEAAPPPQRTRLLALAAELRELVATARSESSVVRHAAEALSLHMTGLMQSVRATLSRAGVYGRRGDVADQSHLHCSVDLRS